MVYDSDPQISDIYEENMSECGKFRMLKVIFKKWFCLLLLLYVHLYFSQLMESQSNKNMAKLMVKLKIMPTTIRDISTFDYGMTKLMFNSIGLFWYCNLTLIANSTQISRKRMLMKFTMTCVMKRNYMICLMLMVK